MLINSLSRAAAALAPRNCADCQPTCHQISMGLDDECWVYLENHDGLAGWMDLYLFMNG